MPINTNIQSLKLKSTIARDKYTFWVEQDILVPDSKPDVMKVLKVEAVPLVTETKLVDGMLKTVGEITYYILYNSMEDGKPRGIITTYPINQTIQLNGVKNDMWVNLDISVKDVIFSLPNERKISVKAELVYTYAITSMNNLNLLSEISGGEGEMETKVSTAVFNNIIERKEEELDISEEIRLSDDSETILEILKTKYKVINQDYKTSYNKILVKGDIELKILYSSGEDAAVKTFETELPFSGMVEFENINERSKFDINYKVKHLDIMIPGEAKTSFTISGDVLVNAIMYEEKEINYITDFYSTADNLKFETNPVNATKSNMVIEKEYEIKETIGQLENDDNYRIVDLDSDTSGISTKLSGENLYLSGNLKLSVMLENKNTGVLESKSYELPFSNTLMLEKNVSSENVDINFEVLNEKISLSGNSITANLMLKVKVEIENIDVIMQPGEISSEKINNEDFDSMYIYIVAKGDTLWDIAKKYKTTVAKIANINNIVDEDNISIGQKLLLIR